MAGQVVTVLDVVRAKQPMHMCTPPPSVFSLPRWPLWCGCPLNQAPTGRGDITSWMGAGYGRMAVQRCPTQASMRVPLSSLKPMHEAHAIAAP
eukprot:364794-Chlamydomonas_euryale.AAC.3